MIASAEKDRVTFDGASDNYRIHYRDISGSVTLPPTGYSSELHVMSKSDLEAILEKHNYFKGSAYM